LGNATAVRKRVCSGVVHGVSRPAAVEANLSYLTMKLSKSMLTYSMISAITYIINYSVQPGVSTISGVSVVFQKCRYK
jgi:hypothetical protein